MWAAGVTPSSADPEAAVITFHRAVRPSGDEVLDLQVAATGPGLDARAWVRTLDGDGLTAFLDELVEGFRGWPGRRAWRSWEGHLAIDAEHTGRRVRLLVALAPGVGEPSWWVTVPVTVAPGEELTDLASRVRAFLQTS
jgi:hypothetical protein